MQDDDGPYKKKHKGEEKEAAAAPNPTETPSAQDERRLQTLWVKASLLAAASAVLPTKEDEATRQARRAAHNVYLDTCAAVLLGKNLTYDPHTRRFVDAFPSLDVTSSRLFYQYFPTAASSSSSPPSSLAHDYSLRIINAEASRNRCTKDTLERYLIRRFRGAFPRTIGLLLLRPRDEVVIEKEEEGSGIEWKVYDATGGDAFNRAFLQATEQDHCDLLLLWRGASFSPARDVDAFYPAYPVFYPHGLLLTPIQVQQLNGCPPDAPDVILALLERATGVLGAVLVASHAKLPYLKWQQPKPDAPGLSTHKQGLESDPRICCIHPPTLRVSHYVPTFSHGWLATDTAVNLATALRAYRPKNVLELGSWYGLSSRFILQEEGSKGIETFITVDFFKNTAFNKWKLEDVTPLDKMYLNHPRFESFYATQEAVSTDAGKVFMLRANVHDAVEIVHALDQPLDLIFIDAEKDTTRLLSLLEKIQRLYPQAVVVGDDLGFASVKAAVAQLNVPSSCLITREESYLLLPPPAAADEGGGGGGDREGAAPPTKDSVLQLMQTEIEPRLAVPAFHAALLSLVQEGKDDEALALAEKEGVGVGGELYTPGKSLIHDICRRRDEKAVAFLKGWVGGYLERVEAGGEETVPMNNVGLTPFDYLVEEINF